MKSKKTILTIILLASTALISTKSFAATAGSSNSTNFRFDPIGLLFGGLGVAFDFKINPAWTIGPELYFISFSESADAGFSQDYQISGYNIAIRANWFNNGVFKDGLYVAPSAGYASAKLTTKDNAGNNISATAYLPYVKGLVGYGWFWNSFNIMLGGGLVLPLSTAKVKVTSSNGATSNEVSVLPSGGLAAEFTLGWTF